MIQVNNDLILSPINILGKYTVKEKIISSSFVATIYYQNYK